MAAKLKRPRVAAPRKRIGSTGEEALAAQLGQAGYAFEREVPVVPGRRWRFDFIVSRKYADSALAVEVEGGHWSVSRHTTGKGFEADCEKYAEAVACGWTVLRVTTEMAMDGRALAYVKRILGEP